MKRERIIKRAAEELSYMQGIRRRIHENPELGFQEWDTQKLVKEELTRFGIPFAEMAKTGVVGIIDSGKPGKCILLRADMDALPIHEKSGVPYASKKDGVMHACGHDAHTANLLGVAKILNEMKDDFCGSIKLMFQPSEEFEPGARAMVAEGVLENPKVDEAIALHVMGDLPKGVIGLHSGDTMAAPDMFEITLRADGGHGSDPSVCTDVVALACQAVTMMHSRFARMLPPFESATMSVCAIQGGDSYNILPAEIHLQGTIRSFNENLRDRIVQMMKDVLKGTCEGTGATFDYSIDTSVKALINDETVTAKVEKTLRTLYADVADEKIRMMKKGTMGSEDFSFVSNLIPSCYYIVGIAEDEDHPIVAHTEVFAFDDAILETCCASMCAAAIGLLNSEE